MLTLVREVIGIAAALGSLSLVIRALVVSHFDLTVTSALTANVSTTTFVISTLIQVAPLALYGGGIAATYHAARSTRLSMVVLAPILACPLVGASRIPVGLALLGGLPAAFLAGHVLSPRNILVKLACGIVLGVVLTNLLPTRMWLPTEQADVAGTTETIYVLRESGEDLVIFDPQTVSVRRVPLAQIRNRQFCQSGERLTLGELLLGRAERKVPACP